ncbi:ectoine/hydroxyectoine ABC transporter substrate-binding protein EhuB [Haloechinothrix halophila]|uniref:ectoine/hydroxyectoine ABC transporter substrate-binding protein EhuB n=1 Tax=Haloechinothrix halophila TaxID=1069073 RepID=UPI0004073007|nr:ectoine/hydroxyectoine ABC transporter substrate-binding protein EhuB [Haloechinothrix halophila]
MWAIQTSRLRRRLAALVGAAALTLAGCGGDGGGNGDGGGAGDGSGLPPKDAPLTIGIANEQPYGFKKGDEVTGFSPDVARAVLKEMGYTNFKFEVVDFGALIKNLQAENFDIVAAGMYLTPDRMKQVAFSDPDYCIGESLAVEEGNPHDIENYQSIVDNPDLTLAVASGTVEVGYAEDAGIPDEQLKTYSGIDQMYAALEAGEVDAVTGTAATVKSQVQARSGIEAVESFIPEDSVPPCGGYAFRLEDQEFRDAFNEQLNEFREDGTTTEIITKYVDQNGPTAEDVAKANEMTTADFEEAP